MLSFYLRIHAYPDKLHAYPDLRNYTQNFVCTTQNVRSMVTPGVNINIEGLLVGLGFGLGFGLAC